MTPYRYLLSIRIDEAKEITGKTAVLIRSSVDDEFLRSKVISPMYSKALLG